MSIEHLPGLGLPELPDRVDLLVAAWLVSYPSPHTRRGYARDVRVWRDWCERQGVPLAEVNRVHLDAWAREGAGYADPKPASLARRLAAVSAFYDYLVQQGVLEDNPATNVRRPSVDRDHSGTRGLTADEAKVLLLVGRERLSLRDQAAVRLMMGSGLRVGSVIGADVAGLGHSRGHRTLTTTYKGNKVITRALPPVTVAVLEEYLDGREDGPLLVSRTGQRLSYSTLFRVTRRAAELAGLEDPATVTPHSLRHTFATLSLDAGASLTEVQDAMGHADPRTTRVYDRMRGRLDRDPSYRLAALG